MLPPRSGPIAAEPDRVRKYDAAPLLLLSRGPQAVLWNRNRNRRNRNFLPCGTGTGTVTCQKIGTGPVRKWYHKSSQKHRVQNCVFDLSFFHSHFTMKLINFFRVKKLRMQKNKIFFQTIFWKRCFLWSRYVTRNLSKDGTGTVTFQKSEPELEL